MSKLFNNQLFIKLLPGVIILIYIFSLVGRKPHVDDAWLGDHAYWLATTGTTKSELMRGITGQEEKIVVHHKLHTYLGAAMISLFGFSLTTLKSLSLIMFVVFLLVFYGYTYKKLLSPREFILGTSLLLVNALIFNHSFVYRPEITVMALGFISYVLLEKSLARPHNKIFLASAGLFAGLAASTHLNGLIFPVAGFVLLLWNRKFKGSIIFALATLPSLGIYFLDMTTIADFRLWHHQITNSPSVETFNESPLIVQLLQRILDEQMRFLHSPMEISLTVLLLITLIPAYRSLQKHRNLLRYSLLLVASLMLFSVHKSSKYLILYLPYLVMIITLSLRYIRNPEGRLKFIPRFYSRQKFLNLLSFVLFGYFAIQMAYNLDLAMDKYDENKSRQITKQFIGYDTDSLNIIAPMTSVFNEIEYFNRIQGEICYNEMKKSDPTIYKAGFLNKAKEFDIDYIILSKFFIVHFGVDQLEEKDLLAANYEMLLKSEDLVILKNHN